MKKDETLLKKIKNFLVDLAGVELEEQKLEDGNTTIEADNFVEGESVVILVPDAESVPLEVGEYKLEDGRVLIVEEEGVIARIVMPETEEEPAEEEMPVEAEVAPTVEAKQPKKVVQITEQHFEKIEETVVELGANIKPIQFNPENVKETTHFDLAPNKNKSLRDSILEQVYTNK